MPFLATHRMLSSQVLSKEGIVDSNPQQNRPNNPSPQQRPRGVLTEVEQRHMLRCVHFLPNGRSVIVGGVNPNSAQNSRRQQPRGGISGGGMSFYLRLWDFDLRAALHPSEVLNRTNAKGLRRRAITNVSDGCAT